jgi:peptidoglycan hydrolase-like protein with peptidoglycan-binding domain
MAMPDRTLSFGMTGTDVRDLQAALNDHLRPPNPPHTPPGDARPPLTTDGVFGPATDARLKEFQRLNELVDDGIVGHLTRPLLTTARSVLVKIPISKVQDRTDLQRGGGRSFNPIPRFNLGATPVTQQQPAPSTPLISPVKLQNRQIQLGGNLTLDPIVGPGAQAKALFLAVQWTWVEQKDGRHLELALGAQAATALTLDPLGLAPSVQSFAQVTIADVVAFDSANFHLFSPAAQVSYQSNFLNAVLKSNSVGFSVQNQITWDATKTADGKNATFSLFCQQQMAWTYDLAARKGTVAPSFLLGAVWTTNFF